MKNNQEKILCKLCEKNEVGIQDSHIIPKFFTESLYFKNGKNQGLKTIKIVNRIIGEVEKNWQQDALKEKGLFCSGCEKFFELLDTHFCNNIYKKLRNLEQNKKYFQIVSLKHTLVFCEKANENIIGLFLLSILIRCHSSNLPFVNKFQLHSEEYASILSMLNKYFVFQKANDLIQKVNELPLRNDFSYHIFTYLNNSKIDGANNFVDINYKSNEGYYYLVINDFVFSVYLKSPIQSFSEALNTNNDKAKIVLLSDGEYNEIRSFGFEKYLNENVVKKLKINTGLK